MHALAKLIERYRVANDMSQSTVQARARSYDPQSGFAGKGSTRIHQIIHEDQPNVLPTRTLKALSYALGAPPTEVVQASLETAGLPLPVDPNTVDPIVSYIQNADIDERRRQALLNNYARHRQTLIDEYRTLVQLEQADESTLRAAQRRFGDLDDAERQMVTALPRDVAFDRISAYRRELTNGKSRVRKVDRRRGTR